MKLLDDTRAIAFNHRVNIQSERKTNNNWQSLKPSNSFHSNNWNTNNCFQNTNWQKSKPNNNFQNGNFKPNSSIQTRNFNWQNSDPYHRSQYRLINNFPVENYSRNSTQQLNSSKLFQYNQPNSSQTRKSYHSRQQRQTNAYQQEPEPMDIGNLKEKADVNFYMTASPQNCP